MQVAVSLTFDFVASQSLDEVEPLILEAGRKAMRDALELVVRQVEELARVCPSCGRGIRIACSERRVVLATFGRVALRLRRLICPDCGQSFRPAETFLGCLEGGNVSGRLKEAAVLAGSSWPYKTASRVLGKLSGAEISHETVRQLTNAQGTTESARQLEEARCVVEPSLEEARAEEERELEDRLRAKGEVAGPRLMVIGLDGGWIPSREQKGGMEGKVGVVAIDPEPIGKRDKWSVDRASENANKNGERGRELVRHRLVQRRYVATFESSEQIGMLAYAAARALGVERARKQEVLGDGARWIKTETRTHFPDALAILDWGHVSRAYHKAIRKARPGKQHQAERRRLYQSVGEALWHGKVDLAIEQLRALRPKAEAGNDEDREPIDALEEAITYFESQRAWLVNYQELRDQGYLIGSGLVEREVELVINRRMKRQGMCWKRETADAVVALRTTTINEDWEDRVNQSPKPKAA